MEVNGTCGAAEVAGPKLHDHECLSWRIVFGGDAEANGRLESEARVVRRVPQYHHRAEPQLSAALEPRTDECGADTPFLMLRRHRHGSQTHEAQFRVTIHRDGGEHDVADDLSVQLRHERDDRSRSVAQRVNEVGLSRGVEGRQVDGSDGGSILRSFSADV